MNSNLAADQAANFFARATESQHEDGGEWEALSFADTPQRLCRAWIGLIANQFDAIETGLVLLKNPRDGAYVPAAFWPNPFTDVSYLAPAAQQALAGRHGVEIPPACRSDGPDGHALIAIPIEVGEELHGAVVLGVATDAAMEMRLVRERLLWGSAWLSQFFLREQGRQAQAALARAGLVMDLALVALEKADFQESAMALMNEIAIKLSLRRASLGLLEKGEIRVRAVSHSAHFKRHSETIQAIEDAMEEAFDQRRDLFYPSIPGQSAEGTVMIGDHEQLAGRHGGGAVASFLLAGPGGPFGVLTLEFADASPPHEEDKALGEAFAKVLGPVLAHKRELDRWVAGKAKTRLGKALEKLLGPDHPSFKLKAVALAAAALFLAFADGEFRVPAKTVVEGLVQRSVVAPFQGYISQASVRAGDTVSAQQTLATLDDKDLRLEQIRWQTEREQALRKYHEAQAKHDRASASVLGAQVNQAEAQLGLIEEKLKRAVIAAPFDGIVVSGDWSQLLGAPVEQGKVLFEVTPLDAYRVILKVDERDIAYVKLGQPGQLVLSGLAGERLSFAVKKITSVTTAEEGINYFRVEAQLDAPAATVRPGMEGVGKILAGEHRLAWIWTRRLTDWLAIKLWTWLP